MRARSRSTCGGRASAARATLACRARPVGRPVAALQLGLRPARPGGLAAPGMVQPLDSARCCSLNHVASAAPVTIMIVDGDAAELEGVVGDVGQRDLDAVPGVAREVDGPAALFALSREPCPPPAAGRAPRLACADRGSRSGGARERMRLQRVLAVDRPSSGLMWAPRSLRRVVQSYMLTRVRFLHEEGVVVLRPGRG